MLLHHRPSDPPHRPRDLVVEIHDPDATVADLASALEPDRAPGPLTVDGRTIAAATPLDRAAIPDGAVVGRPEPDHADAHAPVVTLVVTGGFDTGRRVALAPGPHVLGRSPRRGPVPEAGASQHDPGGDPEDLAGWIGIEDSTVSGEHLRLHIALDGEALATDLGSTNGSRIDGRALAPETAVPWAPGRTLVCGAARLELAVCPTTEPGSGDPPPATGRSGTRPLHRRNRSGVAPVVEPVEIPPDPEAPPPVTPLGVVAVLGSMAVGVVMVVVLGSLTYAIFALLGPVLLVANAVDSRRRRRRTTRLARRRRRTQLRQLTDDLESAAVAESAARCDRFAGPVEVVHRALHRADRLWERRAHHHDAHSVRIATGDAPWQPFTSAEPAAWPTDVAEVVEGATLTDTAVGLHLRPGSPIAVVGSLAAARSVARSILLQAAVHHGPVDLQIAVLAAPVSREAWAWCGWLPHGRDPGAGSLLAGDPASAEELVGELTSAAEQGPVRLVLIDDPAGLEARRSPARSVLRHATHASRLVPVVLVPHVGAVPASVEQVLVVSDDGVLRTTPDLALGPAHAQGTGEGTAREVARILAGFDDPEVDDAGRGLPRHTTLADLVGADRMLGSVVAARWRTAEPDPAPRAIIGQGVDGPVEIDLAADGPHALVAGTTGSGKSELLRTLVASLALGCSPRHLAFVLIDFKGGSAFDACAHLPHVTGVVTDLDDHLAARALRCLEAELHHREAVLRRAGTDDLAAYRRLGPNREPLPRLVVVIDEFATMAAELPDFVDSLVGVAQRGRSLGVHLVLATQRPAGAVSDKIRANTALRVALRVQDRSDSSDVIDVTDASDLPRQAPGRALVRLGPGELVTVQTALVTGRTDDASAPVTVSPLGLASAAPRLTRDATSGSVAGEAPPTDLERLVVATSEAWNRLDGDPPRAVWPDPLPADLAWPLPASAAGDDRSEPVREGLVLGLVDDPDRQRQEPFAWLPDDGPLLVAGVAGSGTTTALATTVLAVSATWSAAEAHLHMIDMGAGDPNALADLPTVGQVVGAHDGERQRRLIQELADDLAARRAAGPGARLRPRRFLVVDGAGALRERWDPLEPSGTWDRFVEITTRGASFGIHVALAAEGPGSVPHNLVSACGQRLVLRLGDRSDHAAFGISPASVPPLPPGRGVSAAHSLVVQVARPLEGLAAAVDVLTRSATHADTARRPARIEVLPEMVTSGDLVERDAAVVEVADDGTLRVAVGVDEQQLATARLVLPPGGHALIAGPPRSGRTSTLTALVRSLIDAGVEVVQIHPGIDVAPADVGRIEGPGPVVVVVDEVDRTADDHPLLGRVAAERRPDRHLIVAGRADRLRSRYAHWTREVRVDRCGILLAPDPDLDGELLGTRIPRAWPVSPRPGLAWAVGAEPAGEGLVQVAVP